MVTIKLWDYWIAEASAGQAGSVQPITGAAVAGEAATSGLGVEPISININNAAKSAPVEIESGEMSNPFGNSGLGGLAPATLLIMDWLAQQSKVKAKEAQLRSSYAND